MLTKVGTAPNLQDLFFQYMSFLSVGTVGNNHISSWLILDPRLSTFFGSTIVVPMGGYIQKEDNVTIWVDNSRSILNIEQCTNFYDDPYVRNGEYNQLFGALSYCYPNGSVVSVLNANSTTPIEDMYNLLQSSSDLPDVVISCGIIKTIQSNGGVWDSYVDTQLNNLFTFCSNNNIKLYCCVAPEHSEYNFYDNNYNSFERFISDTGERLINLPAFFVDMLFSLSTLYNSYRNYTYSYNYSGVLVRRLLQEFMGLDRQEYFVSFQQSTITANSYKEFLYNFSDYQSEEFDKTENGYYDHDKQMWVERKIVSKNDAKNPFKHNGQFVATGLHTSYDCRLWLCEQGGITCKKEADAQINDIDMLPFWQFWSGSPQKRRDIPVYPSTGCPWLTIADVDISNYGVSTTNPIHYYFTKDNLGSTITIRVCDNDCILPDVWQSVEFGRFTHIKDIIYPLYVGGGSVALSPDWWNYFALSHTYGELYNLSMKNPALCNSNILHTTKFGNANMSNFRVLDGGGVWRDIYSAYQEYKDIHYFTLSGFVPEWAECILEHTYNYSFNTGAELVDTRGKIGTLDILKNSDTYNKAYNKYFENDVLDDITVQLNMNTNDNAKLSYGTIPRVYASWGRNLSAGVHDSNGKYWLAIPNGWEDRLWHYKFYYGRIYWEGKNEQSEYSVTARGLEQIEYVRDEYHVLTSGRENKKMITDKLVVDFGRSPVNCSDLSINFPDDYPTSKEVNLILRAYVYADSDTILFSLYSQVSNIEVIFGDGSVGNFKYGEQIKHTYSSSGYYYINIYIDCAEHRNNCLKYECNDNNTGLIYSDTYRNNVVEKLYINPYCPDAIFIDNTVTSPDSSVVDGFGNNIIYLYNQQNITKLYLPYLAKESFKKTGSILHNTWVSWFTVLDCKNITDIYIFTDYVYDYDLFMNRYNSAGLYISSQEQNKIINVYVSDKYSNVVINNLSVNTMKPSVNLQNSIMQNSYLPKINLYLYNKELVKLGNDAYVVNNTSHSEFELHVPSDLLADYSNTYLNNQYANISAILGDIT